MLRIMCNVIDGQQVDRKFNSQTMQSSSTLGYNTNTDKEGRSDNVDVINNNPNMPDYFRSFTNRSSQRGQLINYTKNPQ